MAIKNRKLKIEIGIRIEIGIESFICHTTVLLMPTVYLCKSWDIDCNKKLFLEHSNQYYFRTYVYIGFETMSLEMNWL